MTSATHATEADVTAPTLVDTTPTPGQKPEKARSLWGDAWRELRRSPMFWISAVMILVIVLMAAFPQLFTRIDPYGPDACPLSKSREAPSASNIFGRNLQGCDIYARTIYGARASVLVGLLTTLGTLLLGSVIGILAGYFGGWIDAIVSRLGDIFFAIPLLLGALIILYTFPSPLGTPFIVTVLKVVCALVILGWPGLARLMRSSTLQVKPNDYVQAARALGASPWRIITSHILPNAVAPVIAVAMINLGAYIATEATLSFLGIGLQPPTISWGVDISEASGLGYVRAAPHMLLFPSLFLSLTVLAFIMLGEAVRSALDPKLR